jgi:hypothetical protein
MSEQPKAETPTLVIAPGAFAAAASWNGCTIKGGIRPTFPRKRPTHSPTPFAN